MEKPYTEIDYNPSPSPTFTGSAAHCEPIRQKMRQ